MKDNCNDEIKNKPVQCPALGACGPSAKAKAKTKTKNNRTPETDLAMVFVHQTAKKNQLLKFCANSCDFHKNVLFEPGTDSTSTNPCQLCKMKANNHSDLSKIHCRPHCQQTLHQKFCPAFLPSCHGLGFFHAKSAVFLSITQSMPGCQHKCTKEKGSPGALQIQHMQ